MILKKQKTPFIPQIYGANALLFETLSKMCSFRGLMVEHAMFLYHTILYDAKFHRAILFTQLLSYLISSSTVFRNV